MLLQIISPLVQNFIAYHGACVYYRNINTAVVKLFGARFIITTVAPGLWSVSTSTDYSVVLEEGWYFYD